MTRSLKQHFTAMQSLATRYIMPGVYHPEHVKRDGKSDVGCFAADMIYMLDGPEQREAQSFDYIALSARTASADFHGDLVSLENLTASLSAFIKAANDLDRIKKLLFYGEDASKGRTADAPGADSAFNFRNSIAYALDDGGEVPEHLRDAEQIIHAFLGIASEAGEIGEALYEAFNTQKLDRVNLAEEIGDCQWYEAMLCRAIGTDFDAVQTTNIDKLIERFPDKFTSDAANNRDLSAERAVLEGVRQFNTIEEAKMSGALDDLSGDAHLRDDVGLPLPGTVSKRRKPRK